MNVPTDPRLQHYGANLHGSQPSGYVQSPSFVQHPGADIDPNFGNFALNSLANASVNSAHSYSPQNNVFAPPPRPNVQLPVQTRSRQQQHRDSHTAPSPRANAVSASPQAHGQTYPTPPRMSWDASASGAPGDPSPQSMYIPVPIEQLDRLARSSKPPTTPSKDDAGGGHFGGMKLIPDPPDLANWRARLFNITETITLSEEEFQTYFPHVDNVYSHRSTQKYKRKPFVSHYWDCRLKGRPPGTPKSDDPTKKKRKRNARERDLCDVKIKITEYFPSSEMSQNGEASSPVSGGGGDGSTLTFIMENEGNTAPQPFGMLAPTSSLPPGHPGANGARWYTIQRVNGNVGEKDEDVDLDHKHTLEESDRIKRNSVQRWTLKEEKEQKRAQQLSVQSTRAPSAPGSSTSSTPSLSLRASGVASQTAKRHLQPAPTALTLYANSFCPFAQRVWIALELKQIPYQYVEVIPKPAHPNKADNSSCPTELLEVCPDGIIPCIKHGNFGVWESGVMMEYLEDLTIGQPLLPLGDPQLRAHCRLWTDHINRKILPAFYALLLTPPTTTSDKQQNHPQQQQPPSMPDPNSSMPENQSTLSDQHSLLANTLTTAITSLVNASHATGPFFLGDGLTFVDVAFAPWIIRLSRVLSHYRNFPRPEIGTRWRLWVDAIEADERVRATVSEEGSYHNVYGAVGEAGRGAFIRVDSGRGFVESEYAKRVVREEGFGLGGDVWGAAKEARRERVAAVIVAGGG